jgi:mono/diheme cytochrome c family protein
MGNGPALLALVIGACGGGGAESRGADEPEPGTAAPEPEPEPEPEPQAAMDAGAEPAPADAGAEPVAATDAAPPAADAAAQDPAAAWQAKVEHGRRRYTRLCYAACHDPGLAIAPNLHGKRLPERRVRNQVRQGSGDMDPIPVRRLSDEDLDAVIAYLSTISAIRDYQPPAGAAPTP